MTVALLAALTTLPVISGAQAAETEASLPDIAERAVRGVVSIQTGRAIPAQYQAQFGNFAPQGLGSGVLIDTKGVVITNHHVINGADKVEITLHDGRVLAASVVGSDPRSDVAVLRLDAPPKDLQPLPWGDSDNVRLGETVLAIGNPFGIGHTLTRGIVSAKGRAHVGITEYEDFIQTDAAINPGNSGGALVDAHGRLIGIPTAIFSRSGGTQGIGLAIPSRMARILAADLLEDGKVDRGWLGVAIGGDASGVRIEGITAGTAGEKAGLRAGDVVQQFNGLAVKDLSAFRSMVAFAGAGEAFDVRILRDGKAQVLKGTLGRRPDDPVN